MQFCIRPVDVWLFRDGRPFTAGEDHTAETLFPPSPFTMQGAIRAKVLADKGVDFTVFARDGQPDPDVGYGENYSRLRLFGPLLMCYRDGRWERLIPAPADLVKQGNALLLLRPSRRAPFACNWPEQLSRRSDLLWVRTAEVVKEAGGWLPESEWERYLSGHPPKHLVPSESLFVYEPRFGIAIRAQSQTAQPTMLYQAYFVRLRENTALWAEVEGIPLPSRGILRLGGEGRAAVYEEIPILPPPQRFPIRFAPGERFKVVLITPAWFSGGWQPKDSNWQRIFHSPVNLVAAAIPRPLRLGGFDVARRIPKSVRAFVPAGSVYFFETQEAFSLPQDFAFTETPEDIRQQGGNWAHIGLGKILFGRWEYV